ncbi:MAG: DUF3619 family protein [Betaproteobacteria bacterium]|nr:DUF3619 family protein [Betaproteobacteria bacterium]
MNEQELAKQIVQHLDQGLGKIKQGSLYQLQSARMAALEHYREAPQPLLGLAWAGDIAFRVSHNRHFNARNLFAAGLLVLGMLGVTYWQVAMQRSDIAEIDASLLSDELPINAYLDSGFEAWLKRSSQ